MGLGPASRWEVRDRLRRSGVSGDRRDRPGLCRPDLRSEADADRRRAGDGAPDRLHTVRARTRRISAVPATGRRMQAVRGPVLRTAAVRVRLTSEGRAAGARAVQAVPADAAAPQSAPRRA